MIQLAIEQSLMETDPYHHANYSYNDDVIKTAGDHDYAESYDIGPDRPSKCPKTMHDGLTSQIKMNNSNNSSGIYSSARTTETDDIIKSCSKAVMSSNFDQAASPGLFSDSDSDGLELFHDSDGSQKLTKLEDRTRVKVENRNNNFTSDISDTTSKYFHKGGTSKSVIDTNRENFATDGHENLCVKLPGGKKETKSSCRKQSSGYNDPCNDGSSDTDDFELTIETESEYKRSTTNWCNNTLKSYDKLNHRKITDKELHKAHADCASKEAIKVKNEAHTGLNNENIKDLNDKVETDGVSSGKKLSDDVIQLDSDDSSDQNCSEAAGPSKESASKCDSDGQYVRKCQLDVKDKSTTGRTECLKTDKTADDFVKDNTKSELYTAWNDIMKDDSDKVVKTPNRQHYGQRLEDIGRKMTENSNTESKLLKENGYHGANLLEEKDKNGDCRVEIITGRGAAETDRKHFDDKAVTDFQCNEDGKDRKKGVGGSASDKRGIRDSVGIIFHITLLKICCAPL